MSATAASLLDEPRSQIQEESPAHLIFRRFRKHKLAMISLGILGLIILSTIFVKYLAPFGPAELSVSKYFLPFGSADPVSGKMHLLGTDNIGRDYFSRMLYAGRISLTVALLATLISESVGVTVGAYSGYYGGIVDNLLMRFVEFLLTIPFLPLMLIISSMLRSNPNLIPIPQPVLAIVGKIMMLQPDDARQALLIVIVLAGLGWLASAQIMRGMVLGMRESTFVEAARSMGASDTHIIFRHMIPNALAPIFVNASLNMAGYIVSEAALSFLGFGIQDPIPTWGNMLAATQTFMFDKPYLPLIPGLPIFLCSLCFNFIGDGLRDALDPRLKQ